MSEIRFSPKALEDLRETRKYIAEELCNEQAAVNTVKGIVKQIRMLSAFPESGTPLSSIVDMETDYRFIVCGNYTAFYRLKERMVYIVRVLYGRRNFMQLLFGEAQDKSDI